jgi:hypothetical protein
VRIGLLFFGVSGVERIPADPNTIFTFCFLVKQDFAFLSKSSSRAASACLDRRKMI